MGSGVRTTDHVFVTDVQCGVYAIPDTMFGSGCTHICTVYFPEFKGGCNVGDGPEGGGVFMTRLSLL